MLINADLFACGIATLIQTIGIGPFGIRLPIIMGVTAVSISPMLAMAATVRHWSTFLNGMQQDEAQFRRDTDKVLSMAKAKMARPAGPMERKTPKPSPHPGERY